MLKFDLPQLDTRYSVWLELQTRDELADDFRDTARSLSQDMLQRDAVSVSSPYNYDITHITPYTDLLAAFPDVDPETVYVVPHYEFYGARDMRKYIVNEHVESILDTVMTVTEWVEVYPLEETQAAYAHLQDGYPDAKPVTESGNTAETIVEVRRALTNGYLYVPFSRLMEEFPGLDPSQTFVVTAYGIEFASSVKQEAIDAEFAKRGWRSMRVSAVSDEQIEARGGRILAQHPRPEREETSSPFVYEDRGYRLILR